MSQSIARVGIVAKRGLLAASEHLDRLADWLRGHGIQPVFDKALAAASRRSKELAG